MSHKHTATAPVIENSEQGGYSNGYTKGHVVNDLANGQCFEGHKNGLQNGVSPCKQKGIFLPQLHMKTASLEQGYQFLNTLIPVMLKEALVDGTSVHNKVLEFRHPTELMNTIDLHLSETPSDNNQLIEACRDIIKYSVRTGHPYFYNQLFGGMDMYGMAGAWLTESLNTSTYTYEVAPVFTLMEKVIIDEMLKFASFPDGGDGIFCPGGSMSNMYAINLARFKKFPDIKQSGMFGMPPLVIFTSEKGHYSIAKGASLLGFGSDNVVKVKTDAAGRMIPQELEKEIINVTSEGRIPLIVNATQGSTVLGSYDPLEPIADICSKHNIWLHADGAWGGAVLLSDKLRHKMKGIDRCDSLAWNPHKMMGAPLQASAFLTKHKNLLSKCHCAKAKYLFQQDKFYDTTFDTGDKSVQCGRRVDCLKVWLMWKAKGTQQFAKEVENVFHCAQYLAKKLKEREGFRMVLEEPECTNVCFWYIPASLRGQEENTEWWNKLSKVAPMIKQYMMEQGTMLVSYQPDGVLVNFFRMVVSNTHATTEDMDFVVHEIERLGVDL